MNDAERCAENWSGWYAEHHEVLRCLTERLVWLSGCYAGAAYLYRTASRWSTREAAAAEAVRVAGLWWDTYVVILRECE